MKKKENKSAGSHGIGNRTVIGIICIVAALLICFGVAPVVNRISDGKVSIVRVVRQVEAGAVIGADDVAVVEVGRHNLPEGLVTKTEDVIGKCAKSDLYAGDYILKDKLTGTLAFASGLIDQNLPISAQDLSKEFSWNKLRGDSIYLDASRL